VYLPGANQRSSRKRSRDSLMQRKRIFAADGRPLAGASKGFLVWDFACKEERLPICREPFLLE
jgi:hypothetical protein